MAYETYRDFHIDFDPPPIPVRNSDWHAVHKDYDGAPDANDGRLFHAATLEDLYAQIDDYLGEAA